nr:glutamate receptor U1-like [Parasteatoda tepidariorum]
MKAYFPTKLRIAVLPASRAIDIEKINNTTIISGFDSELIKLLSHALNFEYDIFVPSDNSYGSMDAFGNWTGIVGMVARKEVDMAFSTISITEERSSVADFSVPYYNLEKTFLMNHASFSQKTTAFAYPFSGLTWILFFAVLLIVTVLFRALISPKDSIISVFFNLWGSSFGQGISYNPRSMSRRIPLGIWLLYSYVLILGYSSVLLSFLTSPIKMKQIKDFKDLYTEVRKGKMECLAAGGTYEANYLSQSIVPHLKGLGEYIQKNKWYYYSNISHIVPEHVAILGAPILFQVFLGPPEMYFYSKDVFGNFLSGVAIRKGFCCKERFNKILLRILSGGIYKKIAEDEIFKFLLVRNLNSNYSQSTPVLPLDLSDLNGVFLILGVGWAVAIFTLIMEITYSVWSSSKPDMSGVPRIANVGEHNIKLKLGSAPKKQKPFRIPEALKEEVDRQIEELLQLRLIVPSESEYVHPVIYQVSKAKYITLIDLLKGYWQLKLNPACQDLTSFVTHRGQYAFVVLPFGLGNAAATFQRTMNKVLSKHRDYAESYIDDITIYSDDWDTHLKHLNAVMTTLEEAKFYR